MRQYIFDFKQDIALQRKLDLTELLILDYLIKFFDSGNALTKNIDGKKFCWVSYLKIIDDLPILKANEKKIQRILSSLEKKKIIFRKIIDFKNFICINQITLYSSINETGEDYLTKDDIDQLKLWTTQPGGQICPPNAETVDKNVHPPGQNCPPIVNYYRNKIKLLLDDTRVKNINGERFLFLLKSTLKQKISKLNYEICVENMNLVVISEKLIVLSAPCTIILKENTRGEFYNCVCEALQTALSETPP